jgi:hypothetical protein
MEQEFWAFGTACDNPDCSHCSLPPIDATATATITGTAISFRDSINYPGWRFIGFRNFVCRATLAGTVMGSPILDDEFVVEPATFFCYPASFPAGLGNLDPVAHLPPEGGWRFSYAAPEDAPFADVRCENGVLRLQQAFLLAPFNSSTGAYGNVLRFDNSAWGGGLIPSEEFEFSATYEATPFSDELRPTLAEPYYETFCNGVEYV